MIVAGRVHRSRGTPRASGRVVQLGAVLRQATAETAGDQYSAVTKPCCRVTSARDAEIAGGAPGAGVRIIDFRRGQGDAERVAVATRYQDFAIGQSHGDVVEARRT